MEYQLLNIDDVELDLNNPRIKQWLEIYKENEITSEAIALALSASSGSNTASTYTSLKESIRVNKGIINLTLRDEYELIFIRYFFILYMNIYKFFT